MRLGDTSFGSVMTEIGDCRLKNAGVFLTVSDQVVAVYTEQGAHRFGFGVSVVLAPLAHYRLSWIWHWDSLLQVSRTARRMASDIGTFQSSESFSKVSRSSLESFNNSLRLLGSIYPKYRPSIAPCQGEGENMTSNWGKFPLRGAA